MALPPIPTRHVDSAAHRQRIAETVNGITSFQFDDSRVRTGAEIAAGVTPVNFAFAPDSGGMLNIFRLMTPRQIAAIQSGTNTEDVSEVIQAANDFLEGRAANCILTLTVSAGGSGYTNGTYDCVAMTGGTGTNAKCRIVVAGGAITSVLPAGPQGTHTVNAAGLGNFTVGDSLTPATDNTSTSPLYFPSGGSGAVITVATVSVAGGKTASGLPSGGKLFFPPGYYYCGTSSLRVGAFIEWLGNGMNSVQFIWNSGFTGVGIYFGPDESGLSGFTGYYTMGTVLESLTLNLNSTMTWGILADGVQQGSHFRRLNLLNVSNGGISIKDNKGGVFFKMADIAIVGAPVMPATAGQPTGVAMRIEYGGCVELNQYTTNGGGSGADENGIFLYGIQLIAGSLLLSNYQAEEVLTGIDITSTLSYAVSIDHALFANTSFGVPKGVWVHSTAAPVLNATNVIAGTGIRAIQNDADGYITPSSATYVSPSYVYNGGNATFIAKHQNTIVTGVKSNPTNAAGTFTPDVAIGDWQLINLTTSPMTIAAPLYSGNAMPASLVGQEIVLTVFNNSAGAAPTVNFNAVFHLAGTLTVTTTGQNTSAKFRWTGTAWYQITPWCAVVTN